MIILGRGWRQSHVISVENLDQGVRGCESWWSLTRRAVTPPLHTGVIFKSVCASGHWSSHCSDRWTSLSRPPTSQPPGCTWKPADFLSKPHSPVCPEAETVLLMWSSDRICNSEHIHTTSLTSNCSLKLNCRHMTNFFFKLILTKKRKSSFLTSPLQPIPLLTAPPSLWDCSHTNTLKGLSLEHQ